MKSNLIYICIGIPSVFDSQVLELLSEISRYSIFNRIILLVGIKNEIDKKKLNDKKINDNIIVKTFNSYPNYPIFNFLIRKSLKKTIRELKLDIKKCIFHIRGELIAYHLINSLPDIKENILVDIRGTSIEEVREYYSKNSFQKKLKIYNYKNALGLLNSFNKISVVSSSLKRYLIKNYNVVSEKINIIPSQAGRDFKFSKELRQKTRQELLIDDNTLLFVFSSGGGANWQNMQLVEHLCRQGYRILNLSNKRTEHPNVINKFVSYQEMPAYLNAADIAIIWRDASLVNQVASPVKFSEYVCCGLPVIANEAVHSITNFIQKNKCGIIINNFNDLTKEKIYKLVELNREEISKAAQITFSVYSVVNMYKDIYRAFI